ncbi:MAG TPA: ribonuclease H-like domain-containing protein, partial [Vicinamibacteria bacterium]|nr:ribonuclease H-like domain-containing protein [Vicinamibacteria bacterium]
MTPPSIPGQRAAPGAGGDREAELAQLRARLRRLEARHAVERPRPADPLALESVPTPHGPALRRVETVRAPAAVAAGDPPAPGTVFLDTETTGLAGGTGTYVFLVGLATWTTGQTLTVTQYFLGDLGAEAAFLHAVREAVAAARELVTFNGRTFDLPLLETRYLLARASWWGAELPHRDLYPVARALWRGRATDCRLSTLEAALLGLDRGDDLPGALVPQVYFRYLRTRDPGPLPRIFRHNRWDLVALAGLHGRA